MAVMRSVLAFLLLSGLAFGDLSSLALAEEDIVHLRNGGKIEGKVSDKGDRLEVETANGKVSVEKDLVERIEKKDFTLPKGMMAKKPAKLGAPYAHPFYAFKLYLPPKWAYGKSSGQAAASFWGPKDQLYQPRMDLFYQVSKKELVDFVTAYKDAFRKGVKDVQFVYEEASAIRDKQGYQFSVTFTDGDLPVVQQALFTFISDGDRKYVLGFNTSQAWFERYYPIVDASMRSFRIFPASTLTAEDRKRFLLRYQSGEQYYREGKLSDALGDFQAASQICPEFADLHSTIATIHMKQARFPDAEAEYKRAVEIDPDDSNHHYNLGVCLLKQSKSEGAIDALKKAVVLDPAFEPALTNLGAAYLGKDQNDLARQTLEKAVQADPESAPAHYNLGLSLERLDRKKDAEREYKEALSADPKHEDAKKALDRIKSKK
ncbi:MAG: tetratricopeptide repeat protein [Planctomycetes bacterium]|nr:tetratricopeptide repeat protein [Planctomycetota bacterium]